SNGVGPHKLVLKGFANPDDLQPDVLYKNWADDPDNPNYVAHSATAGVAPAQTSEAALVTGIAKGPANGSSQGGAGIQVALAAAMLNLGHPAAPILSDSSVPVGAASRAAPDSAGQAAPGSASVALPGVWP